MSHGSKTSVFVVLVYVAQMIKTLMPFLFYLDIANVNYYWSN